MYDDRNLERPVEGDSKLDAFLRARPRLFTVLLCLIAAGITAGLLYRTEFSTVLYQGF